MVFRYIATGSWRREVRSGLRTPTMLVVVLRSARLKPAQTRDACGCRIAVKAGHEAWQQTRIPATPCLSQVAGRWRSIQSVHRRAALNRPRRQRLVACRWLPARSAGNTIASALGPPLNRPLRQVTGDRGGPSRGNDYRSGAKEMYAAVASDCRPDCPARDW
jgi:hypothetical protein